MKISFQLNGKAVTAEGNPMDRLLDFEMTGTKEGCGEGECGACTVMMDDQPVLSCLVPLIQCEGHTIVTVEGVTADPGTKEFLDRFVAKGGSQCGACTPGIIVTGWALGRDRKSLSREEIRTALAGNLCRCTGYEAILQAMEHHGEEGQG